MGATENGVFELARRGGIRLDRQVTVAGLSNRGHLDPVLQARAPGALIERLSGIFAALGGDPDLLAAKSARPLQLDFYAPELDLYIEVDEIQHFTTDRRLTLDSYPDEVDVEHLDAYRDLIGTWRATADRYRAAKPTTDFPHPGGRRAQRAFLDAIRDLAAPQLGIRILRIPAPECHDQVAFRRLEARLGVPTV